MEKRQAGPRETIIWTLRQTLSNATFFLHKTRPTALFIRDIQKHVLTLRELILGGLLLRQLVLSCLALRGSELHHRKLEGRRLRGRLHDEALSNRRVLRLHHRRLVGDLHLHGGLRWRVLVHWQMRKWRRGFRNEEHWR